MPVRYPDDEALKEAVKELLKGQTDDFYFSGINSLPEKLHKDYIEKLSVVCNISFLLYGRVAKLFWTPLV